MKKILIVILSVELILVFALVVKESKNTGHPKRPIASKQSNKATKEDPLFEIKFIGSDTIQILKEGEYVISDYVKVR
jgi:uncharacterized protein YxeA